MKKLDLFFSTIEGVPTLSRVRVKHPELCDASGNPSPVQDTTSVLKLNGSAAMYAVALVFVEYALHRAKWPSATPEELPSLELVGKKHTSAASVHAIVQRGVAWMSCFGFIDDGRDPIPYFLQKAIGINKRPPRFIISLPASPDGYRYIGPHEISVTLDKHLITDDAVALEKLIGNLIPETDRWDRNTSASEEPPAPVEPPHCPKETVPPPAQAPPPPLPAPGTLDDQKQRPETPWKPDAQPTINVPKRYRTPDKFAALLLLTLLILIGFVVGMIVHNQLKFSPAAKPDAAFNESAIPPRDYQSTSPSDVVNRPATALTVVPSITIGHLLFNPSGTVLRAAAFGPNAVGLQWEIATGKAIDSQELQSIYDVFSPDGNWLFVPGLPLTGQRGTKVNLSDSTPVDRAVFSADGSRIAVITWTNDHAHIRVHRTIDGLKLFDQVPFSTGIWGFDLSPDGRWAAAAGGSSDPSNFDLGIHVWSVDTGADTQLPLPGKFGAKMRVRFSWNGSRLCALHLPTGGVTVYSLTSGSHDPPFAITHTVSPMDNRHVPGFIDVTPNNFFIVWCGAPNSNQIGVWNTDTALMQGPPIIMPDNAVLTTDPVPSPDGTRILTADSGYTVRLWDVLTCKQIAAFPTGRQNLITALAFSADGLFAASADDSAVLICRLPPK